LNLALRGTESHRSQASRSLTIHARFDGINTSILVGALPQVPSVKFGR